MLQSGDNITGKTFCAAIRWLPRIVVGKGDQWICQDYVWDFFRYCGALPTDALLDENVRGGPDLKKEQRDVFSETLLKDLDKKFSNMCDGSCFKEVIVNHDQAHHDHGFGACPSLPTTD